MVLKSKSVIGCRDDFYLTSPNGKAPRIPSWREPQTKTVSVPPLTTYWNEVYKTRTVHIDTQDSLLERPNWQINKGEKVELIGRWYLYKPIFDKIVKV